MNVNLHIERLVLDGLPVEQRQGAQLRAAVERELTRLLANAGALARLSTGGPVAAVDGGAIQVAPGADSKGLGKQIAAAVNGGLGGGR